MLEGFRERKVDVTAALQELSDLAGGLGAKSLNLGALMGWSTGESNTGTSQIPLYVKEGITHFDFSATLPLTIGVASFTPNAHFQVNVDDNTKFTSGTQTNGKTVFTIGTTISWSKAFGGAAAE